MGIVFSAASFLVHLLTRKRSSKFQPLPGITLYDSSPSPCARRVRMTLLEKGMPFIKVEVDLLAGEQTTEEFKHICPNKKVPAISFVDVPGVEDCSLYESNVITEFLDSDAFPGPKLYPRNHWERAQVKMWQDWELGLVDDFVPYMYSNMIPFILQLMHGSKESYLSSLPSTTSSAKKQYMASVYDASLSTTEELKQHAMVCYQNLITLEKALEGREFLVGDTFTSADLSVLPRVSMYNDVGLNIPESHFPNIVSYLKRLRDRASIRHSQPLMFRLWSGLMARHAHWVVRLGNWRTGRNLQRLNGSLYLDQALSQAPRWKHEEAWQRQVEALEADAVLLTHCPVYPECWQIKLLLQLKGVKITTLQVDALDVVGRWAGSEGLVRIHHGGHEVIGIRAVLDYLDGVFVKDMPRLLPADPLQRAKAQTWQAWDCTLGYIELSHLLETRLISKVLAERYCTDFSGVYDLRTNPYYQSKFVSILHCFICGVMNDKNSENLLKDLQEDNEEAVNKARKMIEEEKQWEDFLRDRLTHLDTELQSHSPYLLGQTLTLADVTVFCRVCFLRGLGLVDSQHHRNVIRWSDFLVDTRQPFQRLSQDIADMLDMLKQ